MQNRAPDKLVPSVWAESPSKSSRSKFYKPNLSKTKCKLTKIEGTGPRDPPETIRSAFFGGGAAQRKLAGPA